MDRKKIAEERIEILFQHAEEKFEDNPELAERYVELAKRIGERVEVPIPKEFRKRFCSNCSTYWKLGENCKVKLNSKKKNVEYRCRECGEVERYGY